MRGRRAELARDALLACALWLISFVVVALLALRVHEPVRHIDEFLFWAIAKNFAAGDGFSWRGAPLPLVAELYPWLLSFVFRFSSGVQQQYEIARVLGAGAVTAVVLPAYLAARALVSRSLAVLAAVLCVLAPTVCYAGLISTETVAYPLAAAALFALVHALYRPGWPAVALFVCFFALASATRVQLTVIYAVALLSLVAAIAVGGERPRRTLLARHRALAVSLGVIGAIGLLYLALRRGTALGIYEVGLRTAEFDGGDLWYWLRAYSAEVYLLCGVLPAIATFALAFDRRARVDPKVRALLIVTLASVLVLVVQIVLFSATNHEFWRERSVLYERYLVYLGPLLFVGFAWSFGRVSSRAVMISTALAAVVLASFPLQAVRLPFSLDAFGQAYIGYLLDAHRWVGEHLGLLLALLTLALGGCFALARSERREGVTRVAGLLAVALPIYLLAITQLKAWQYQEVFSADVQAAAPQPSDWMQRIGDDPVAVLVGAGTEQISLYGAEFRNPRIASVYLSEQAPVDSPKVFSPVCILKLSSGGVVLPTEWAWCRSVPSTWLSLGSDFAMRLRDARQLAVPGDAQAINLQEAAPPVRILAMVGGRNRVSGVIEDQLVVRTFFDEPGAIRIQAVGGKVFARHIPSGERLTRVSVAQLGLGKDPKTEPLEVVEGGGQWLPVR